jgi:hypothetical protein
MNLLQAIHQRWAAAEALNALLPATSFFTGASPNNAPPFATMLKQSDKPDSYETDGSAVDVVVLRMQVVHAQHSAAAEIVHQIKKTFDRTSFDLAGGDSVQMMQRANDFEQQRDDGAWQMTIDFKCTVYLAAGA